LTLDEGQAFSVAYILPHITTPVLLALTVTDLSSSITIVGNGGFAVNLMVLLKVIPHPGFPASHDCSGFIRRPKGSGLSRGYRVRRNCDTARFQISSGMMGTHDCVPSLFKYKAGDVIFQVSEIVTRILITTWGAELHKSKIAACNIAATLERGCDCVQVLSGRLTLDMP
jgi:hypothetical protein